VNYKANGKLLLTGEYSVLDGAKALALPTKLGQTMAVKKTRGSDLVWESLDHEGNSWFKSTISLLDFSPINTTDDAVSERLRKLLKNAVRLNSEFLSKWNGFKVETQLGFPRDWGLGSSSTLTYLIAEWAGVHPLLLAMKSSNGSGYDVACAGADGPIVFQSDEDAINYTPIDFKPEFHEQLYFVHLGRKQNTDDQIKYYLKQVKNKKALSKKISDITEKVMETSSFSGFEKLICEHEEMISSALNLPKASTERFSDYWGCVKSLGAWGGDFVLVTSQKSKEETEEYFESKDLKTVIPYNEMIISPE